MTCDEQRARLIARGMDPADADRRIAAQAGMADRVRAARPDLVEIDTSGSVADAERRVARQWQRLIGDAAPDDSMDRVSGGQGERE